MTRTGQTLALTAAGAAGLLLLRAIRERQAVDFAGRTVVISGGSRGLGLVLARQFAAEGARLVLLARDRGELDRARMELEETGAQVDTIPCDVTDPAQVDAAIEGIAARHRTIDVLVNNAGIIQVGPFEHMTMADFDRAMATHFRGPLMLVLAALPLMRRQGLKRIVNIASIGGRVAVPHLLPYAASKFALTGLSEGLRAELAREGFSVTTVSPGLMRTGSSYNAWFKGHQRREFAWFHIFGSMPGVSIDARRAGRLIVEATRHGAATLTLTPAARVAVWLNALCPHTTARLMSLTNRLLPGANHSEAGAQARSGWQSISRVVPSRLTALSDRASVANNELPAR